MTSSWTKFVTSWRNVTVHTGQAQYGPKPVNKHVTLNIDENFELREPKPLQYVIQLRRRHEKCNT